MTIVWRVRRSASQRGYSLTELMIVCLVLGLLAAKGLEFASGLAERQRLQAGCDLLVSAAERARSLAVFRNGPYRILVRPDGRAFAVAPQDLQRVEVWRDLPPGVRFTRRPARPVTFFSRGGAVPGGTFGLACGDGSAKVVVAPSGRIRWEGTG